MTLLHAGPGGPLGRLSVLLDHVTGAPPQPPLPSPAASHASDEALLCWPYLARVPGGARAVRRERGSAA